MRWKQAAKVTLAYLAAFTITIALIVTLSNPTRAAQAEAGKYMDVDLTVAQCYHNPFSSTPLDCGRLGPEGAWKIQGRIRIQD